MTLTPAEVDSEARRLVEAARANRVAELPGQSHPELTIADGYAIQAAAAAQRVAAGDRVIGMKLGLTSKAKQEAMGLDQPAYGVVFAGTLHPAGEPIDLDGYIHPRIEPEIVFRMGERLSGPGVDGVAVLAATEAIGCGFEIIDSRFDDFRFTMADAVADNSSAAGLVLGSTWLAPSEIPDLAEEGLALEVDGEQVATATGAAVLGHPAEAVAWLANQLGAEGMAIEPGWLVLSGAMTAAIPLTSEMTVEAGFDRLGALTVGTAGRPAR